CPRRELSWACGPRAAQRPRRTGPAGSRHARCGRRSSARTAGRSGGRSGPLASGARVGLERAVVLERRDLADAPPVALLVRERRRDETVDEAGDLLERVLAGADRDDVRVVVLPRELRGGDAPHERG